MKGKYAIGQLVELKTGHFGKVTGINHSVTSAGTSCLYSVSGSESQVNEDFIVAAYSPIVHRTRKAKETVITHDAEAGERSL